MHVIIMVYQLKLVPVHIINWDCDQRARVRTQEVASSNDTITLGCQPWFPIRGDSLKRMNGT